MFWDELKSLYMLSSSVDLGMLNRSAKIDLHAAAASNVDLLSPHVDENNR